MGQFRVQEPEPEPPIQWSHPLGQFDRPLVFVERYECQSYCDALV